MAEYVQQSMEQMLPELQQLRRVGLLTKKETERLICRRKHYEYKLRRRTKEKRDYLKYIQYEVNVLNLIKKRREKIGYHHKLSEIDTKIVNRIYKLFRLAQVRFQDDIKLWMSHIEFAKNRNHKSVVVRQYSRALQIHSTNVDLWIGSASYQFYVIDNMELARSLFQKGLHINSSAEELWYQYFKSELIFTTKMIKRAEDLENISHTKFDMNDNILNGQLQILIYNKMIENIPDNIKLCFRIAALCSSFAFGKKIETFILNDIKTRFPKNPLTYMLLAENSNPVDALIVMKKGLLQATDKTEMCSLYAEFCFKNANYENAFEIISELNNYIDFLDETIICKCILLLNSLSTTQIANDFCNLALSIKKHKNSASIWSSKILLGNSEQILEYLENAIIEIKPINIWTVFETSLMYIKENLKQNNSQISNFICEYISSSKSNSNLKINYFNWVLENEPDKLYEVYQKLIRLYPKPNEIYEKILEQDNIIDKNKTKIIVEELIREHPKNVDTWYIAIKFYQQDPIKSGQLHRQAINSLEYMQLETFKLKISNLL